MDDCFIIQVCVVGLGVDLPMSVKKSWTIGQVVRQVENAYLDWKQSNESSSAVSGLPERIECGALFDADPTLSGPCTITATTTTSDTSAPVPLRYTDSVEQVLDTQSRLYAVNILSHNTAACYQDLVDTGASNSNPVVETFQSPDNDLPTLSEGLSSPISASSPTVLSAAASPPPPSSSSSNPASPITTSTITMSLSPLSTRPRPRSRVTGQLLLLTNPRESSSNDARFQAILHNTIALDHFRQFCFQEYSIENLLFWMDVELFSSPSQETLEKDKKQPGHLDLLSNNEEDDEEDDEDDEADDDGGAAVFTREKGLAPTSETVNAQRHPSLSQQEPFSVQHARYIYLTYIDACAPLQVNLSDEIRSEIPWPIVDESHDGMGPAVDRHMFDGAQEHIYQLMKGHTLARFEESDLWKAVEKMIQEKPEEYNRANIDGGFNSYYRPRTYIIRDLVRRSKSRNPSVQPHALYNWNNSTSDLDRARDKEETLAEVMRQYFGPIPAALHHQTKLLRGLGLLSRAEEEEYELGLERAAITATSGTLIGDGEGSGGVGDALTPPPRMPRSNSSNTFLSVYGTSPGGGDSSNRNSFIASTVDLATTKRYSTASTIATRWMVAGYFDDEIRLTSAQRRKLLRRNNKLTRFFGSRVDGTLMPVSESPDHPVGPLQMPPQGSEKNELPTSAGRRSGGHRSTASSASIGSSIAIPAAMSSLSMALSTSNLREQGSSKKEDAKRLGGKADKRAGGSGNGNSPAVTSVIGSSRRGSKSMVIRLPSQRERFFARFRPRSTYAIESATQPTSPVTASEHHRFSFVIKTPQSDSAATSNGGGSITSFPSLKEGFLGRTSMSSSAPTKSSHKRVATLPHPLPHPLWMDRPDRRGSLSDQEGLSPSDSVRHRQRLGSLISVFGGDAVAAAAAAAVATDGTSPIGATRSTAQPRRDSTMQNQLSDLDPHQTLRSRRKKADKLASFFGTQLSPWELSTQLKMEQECDSLASDQNSSEQERHSSSFLSPRRSSESSHIQSPPQLNPTYASINQLSERDRSILWKRSKKLKELLGQTLPEMDVETALTRPILRRRGSSRSIVPLHHLHAQYAQHLHVPAVSSVGSFRRRRPGSRVSIRPRRQSNAGHSINSRRRHSTVSTSGTRPISTVSQESSDWLLQGHQQQDGSKTPTTPRRSMRSPAASNVTAQHQQYLAPGEYSRQTSSGIDAADRPANEGIFELEDTVNDDDDDDDLYEEVDTEDEDGVGSVEKATPVPQGDDSQNPLSAMHPSRLDQKKRMDKIHQFMGERVPKQDLWVGTVGREHARKMMESFKAEDQLYAPDDMCWEDASPPPPSVAADGRRQTLSGGSGGIITSPIARLRPRKTGLMAKRKSKKAAAAQFKEKQEKDEDGISSFVTGGPLDNNDSSRIGAVASSLQHSTTSPLGGLLNGHRTDEKKVRQERSLSDPPALPSFAPRAFVKGVFRSSNKDGHGSGNIHDSSTPSCSMSSPKNSTAIAGRASADAILSKTTYYGARGSTAAAGEQPKGIDEETLQSMPRFRTMATEDKERFMKRAEKLNRLFGAIPPSILLESSLTTFPLTRGLRTEDEEVDASGNNGQAQSPPSRERSTSGGTAVEEASLKKVANSKHHKSSTGPISSSFASLSELAGRLANHSAGGSGGGSSMSSPGLQTKVDLQDDTASIVESLAA